MMITRKIISKILTGVLVVAMIFGTAVSVFAYTSETKPSVSVAKDGDKLALTIIASDDTQFGGVNIKFDFDKSVFTYDSTKSDLGVTDGSTNQIFLDTARAIAFNSGETIATVYFNISDIEPGTEYEFTVTFVEAYDDDLEDHSWLGESASATYKEPEEETTTEAEETTTEAEETTTEAEETTTEAEETTTKAEETTTKAEETTTKAEETTTKVEEETTTKAEETTTKVEEETTTKVEEETTTKVEEETTAKAVPANNGGNNNNGGSQSDSSVKTADATNLIVLVAVMVVCGMVIASVIVFGKRKNCK